MLIFYVDQVDPTSYYPDFWNYAAYYGEAAARAYYTVWSPPVGTPPPEGLVLPVYSTDSQQNTTASVQVKKFHDILNISNSYFYLGNSNNNRNSRSRSSNINSHNYSYHYFNNYS